MHALLLLAVVAASPRCYEYTGEIAPLKTNTASPDVRFTIHYFAESPDSETIYWLLQCSDSQLTERFGSFDRQSTDAGLPRLPYDRPENRHLIAIHSPWFLAGKDFSQTPQYEQGDESVAAEPLEKNQWRVTLTGKYGRRRVAVLAGDDAPIASFQQNIFFGQGVEHSLKWRLNETTELTDTAFQQAIAALEELQALKDTPDRVADIEPTLKRLQAKTSWPPLTRFLATGVSETSRQTNQADAVAELIKKSLGKAVPEFELELADGGAIKREDLGSRITVLHFWKYRTSPLRKPYGQVGYLDYLRRQLPAKKVAVYGVTVDPRASETSGRQAVVRDAKQMREFMNLSYPILVDDGEFLKAIGDPRTVGVALPLFVVLNAEGEIIHFHPDVYSTQANRGLEELQEVIAKEMAAQD